MSESRNAFEDIDFKDNCPVLTIHGEPMVIDLYGKLRHKASGHATPSRHQRNISVSRRTRTGDSAAPGKVVASVVSAALAFTVVLATPAQDQHPHQDAAASATPAYAEHNRTYQVAFGGNGDGVVVERAGSLGTGLNYRFGVGDSAMSGVAFFVDRGEDDAKAFSPQMLSVAPPYIERIYHLVASDEIDEALDTLIDHLDDMFLAGEFSQCNEDLKTIDITKLDANLIVGVLSVTLAAKEHLPYRAQLFRDIQAHLEKQEPARVHRLLVGLS